MELAQIADFSDKKVFHFGALWLIDELPYSGEMMIENRL